MTKIIEKCKPFNNLRKSFRIRQKLTPKPLNKSTESFRIYQISQINEQTDTSLIYPNYLLTYITFLL